jgi:transposase
MEAPWPVADSEDTGSGVLLEPEVDHERREFDCEFKLEAVKLINGRGVSALQTSRGDPSLHGTVLRNWVKAFADDPAQAFPGHGQMKPEQAKIWTNRGILQGD